MELEIPCGQCVGCRLERSRQWAMRCVHEAQMHENNCFITLTYDDDHLPVNGSLNKKHYQDFMKRLRKYLGDQKVRYFHCGEYGEKYLRPHYHAIIFGYDFPDKEAYSQRNGNINYTSKTLTRLWSNGLAVIGDVTFESAAYVARYVMKKRTGEDAKAHYTRVIEDTGQVVQVEPEYTTMSRRPGIGSAWYEKFKSDAYPKDFITLNGKKMRPPKAYDNTFEVEDPEGFEKMKIKRVKKAKENAQTDEQRYERTLWRLREKETVKKLQTLNLKRTVE